MHAGIAPIAGMWSKRRQGRKAVVPYQEAPDKI